MNTTKYIKFVVPHCILVATLGLAATLATSVSMAASNLTMYGIIDLSLYYNHVSRDAGSWGPAISGSQAGMTSGVLSGSRWGIKGSEPLSDQWSVQFVLEEGVNAQNGSLGQGGLGFGRQSTLAIANNRWGSVQFGRAANLAYSYLVPFDPFSISGSQAGWGASFGSANGVRPNNLLLYQSGNMYGWQASVGYSFNTGFSAIYANGPSNTLQPGTQFFGTSANMRMLTAALRYSRGGLALLATYDAVYGASQFATGTGQTVANTNQATPKAWLAAASYDFKVVKVSAVIGQTFDGAFFGQGAGAGGYSTPLTTFSEGSNVLFAQGAKSSQYALGATIPVGPQGRVLLSWQMLQPTGALKANTELATQNIFSAGYVYNLSKRTDVYVWGSYGNNYQTFSTARSSVVGTGVRHFF
ncbi:porin [Orrella daihaiensis]|uniref:Porin n=1 Tax=Orrella daihaiensis TaxID=2782176 RepID=A0ABY4ALU3_9BURK|nr:porin [Orrella daihaiensis]UOD51284.1 porin [Orrella daihaiensis]